MLAMFWRACVALADWRNILRIVFGLPSVVFVTNMRDIKDRKTFLGKWHPPESHFNGPRYWIHWVAGRTRALDLTIEEMSGTKGWRRAKELFIKACQWAEKQQASVILAAAGTKRLFEYDSEHLKNLFPGIIFTIGDNGTSLLLKGETIRALEQASLKSGFYRIAVLGPYGFLGEIMTRVLVDSGYNVIGAGPNVGELQEVKKKFSIEVCKTFAEMGEVDAVVACTHSDDIRLNAENIELIRRQERKLLVVDVAEPSNLVRSEYEKCKQFVIRQDAGNAYAPKLKYVLGAISYRMFRLTKGVTFGCFAEALALAWGLRHGYEEEIRRRNWFQINDDNMAFVDMLFEKMGFTIPSPRCFGQPVNSFNLNLEQPQTEVPKRLRFAERVLHLFM